MVQPRKKSDLVVMDKREEILDVAALHFLSHGYEGTSINEMARRSGISKESIYRYFPSKKELFRAVIDQELEGYQANLRRTDLEFKKMTLRDALIMTAEIMLENLTSDRTLALNRLIFQETTTSKEIGQYYFEIGPKRAIRSLENLFSAHRQRTDFEPAALSRNFRALVLHGVMLERRSGLRGPLTKAEVKELAGTTVDDFLKAYFKS